MPYASEHMLMQWGGNFAAAAGAEGNDEFAGTLRFAGPGVLAADNDATGDVVADTFAEWWGSQYTYIPAIARLRWLKWNRIGTDGRYVNQGATRLIEFPNDVPGTVPTVYPLQVCWVSTWTTDFQRGRAARGRTYWPTAVPVTGQELGRVASGPQGNFLGALRSLIPRLNQAAQLQGGGVVASVMSDLDAGRTAAITGVRVGNRLDIQRRRDNKMPEAYQLGSIGTDPGGQIGS